MVDNPVISLNKADKALVPWGARMGGVPVDSLDYSTLGFGRFLGRLGILWWARVRLCPSKSDRFCPCIFQGSLECIKEETSELRRFTMQSRERRKKQRAK